MNHTLCESTFEWLAVEDPGTLIAMLKPPMSPHLLTYAAEIAGKIPGDAAIDPLLRLLDHDSALVREGAVYGLCHHTESSRVLSRLKLLAESDLSPGVRAAARGAVELAP